MTAPKKALILEDQMLIAFDLAAILQQLGIQTVGPYADVDSALRAVETETFDLALLDINLGNGTTSVPVAVALQERDKPFAFVTSYGSGMILPERFDDVVRCNKPVRREDLSQVVKGFGLQ